jgi:hypothetical protein
MLAENTIKSGSFTVDNLYNNILNKRDLCSRYCPLANSTTYGRETHKSGQGIKAVCEEHIVPTFRETTSEYSCELL